jgi:hypothetical protein
LRDKQIVNSFLSIEIVGSYTLTSDSKTLIADVTLQRTFLRDELPGDSCTMNGFLNAKQWLHLTKLEFVDSIKGICSSCGVKIVKGCIVCG